jgi:rhodanese-related sulfurtransferase
VERWSDKILKEQQNSGFPAVSLEQAIGAFVRGEALFVDARAPEFYRLGHVPGALNLPLLDFDRVFPLLRDRLLSAPQVIAYCDGAGCEMSVGLTEKLLMAGIDRVAVFTGGMQQWKGAGQQVEVGAQGVPARQGRRGAARGKAGETSETGETGKTAGNGVN